MQPSQDNVPKKEVTDNKTSNGEKLPWTSGLLGDKFLPPRAVLPSSSEEDESDDDEAECDRKSDLDRKSRDIQRRSGSMERKTSYDTFKTRRRSHDPSAYIINYNRNLVSIN